MVAYDAVASIATTRLLASDAVTVHAWKIIFARFVAAAAYEYFHLVYLFRYSYAWYSTVKDKPT